MDVYSCKLCLDIVMNVWHIAIQPCTHHSFHPFVFSLLFLPSVRHPLPILLCANPFVWFSGCSVCLSTSSFGLSAYLSVCLCFVFVFDLSACLSLVMVCLSVSGCVVSLFLVLVVCFCLSVSGFVGLSVVLVCSPLFLSLILIFCMSVRVSVSGLVVCLSFWFLSSAGNKPNYKGPKIEVRQQTRSIEEGKRVNLFCRLTEEPESGKWYHLRVLRARLYNHLLVFGVDSGRGEEEGLGRGRWEGVEEIAVHAQNVKSGIFVRNTG